MHEELNNPKAAQILLVGERQPWDFRILEAALTEAGLKRRNLNFAWLYDRGGSTAGSEETLPRLVERLRPSVVVALGGEAASALVAGWPRGDDRAATQRRGYVWGEQPPVLTTVDIELVSKVWVPWRVLLAHDLERVREIHEGHYAPRLRQVYVISNAAEAQAAVKLLADYEEFAVDIENYDSRRIACIGVAPTPGEAWVFPAPYIAWLRPLLEDLRYGKIFQNGAYDSYFLRTRLGWNVSVDDDTMLAFHACYPELAGRSEDKDSKTTQKSLKFLASLYTWQPWWKCLDAESRVLMKDLTWKPIKNVKTGDEIVGFSKSGKRCLEKAVVIQTNTRVEKTKRIVTDRGELIATDEHWLCSRTASGFKWIQVRDLEIGQSLAWALPVWEEDLSWDAGYVAGFFDGEGFVQLDNGVVGATQNPNPSWVKVQDILRKKHFNFSVYKRRPDDTKKTETLHVRGGWGEKLRFLGTFKVPRLASKFLNRKNALITKPAKILRIEDAGERDVCDIATTSETFIAEGFCVHNSYDFQDESERYTLNGLDCCVTLEIMWKLREEIARLGVERIYHHELRLVPAVNAMLERGIQVDDVARQTRMVELSNRQSVLEAELDTLVRPILAAQRPEVLRLFTIKECCRCCRGGSGKSQACWRCAGFEKAPTKTQLRALGRSLAPCVVCGGRGKWQRLEFNPLSVPQKQQLLYDFMKLPKRYKDGKLSTDEMAIKALLAGVEE